MELEAKLCECGCGEYAKPGRRYINGHTRKGKHCSEEMLEKLRVPKSEAAKEALRVAQNKPETKKKRSASMVAAHARPEVKEKYAKTNAKPEVKEKRSKSMTAAHARPEVKSRHLLAMAKPETKSKRKTTDAKPEVKERRSNAMIEVGARLETKKKRSKSAKIAAARPEEKARRIKSAKENWEKPGEKERISKAMKEAYAKPGMAEKKSITAKKLWQDPEFVRKQMEANCVTQNKMEKKLEGVIESIYSKEYKFVGHGEVIIAGKCPDFININGQKKIIELFGDYWHKGHNPQDRIDIFTPYGYDTLVIWEHELKDIEKLKLKIIEFHERPQPKHTKEILDGKA